MVYKYNKNVKLLSWIDMIYIKKNQWNHSKTIAGVGAFGREQIE